MALLWIDGFDHYGTTSTDFKTSSLGAYDFYGNSNLRNETMPVLGTQGFQKISGNPTSSRGLAEKLMSISSGTTIGIGCHVYPSSYVTNASGVFGLATVAGAHIVRITIEGGGRTLQVRTGSGNGSVVLDTEAPIQLNVLYHLEAKIYVHSTDGSVELRLNGITVGTVTNINTEGDGVGRLTLLPFGTGTTSTDFLAIDNLFVWDDTGSYNNDWLGERNIYTLMPSADTAEDDWALSSGSDGYALINTVPSNSANYISAASSGAVSSFEFDDLISTDITVVGVQTVFKGLKTGTAVSEVECGIEVAGQKTSGPALAMIQDQETLFSSVYDISPDTGVPFTPDEINNALVFVERVT